MVKNVNGGNKSKGFARKNMIKKDTSLRVSEDDAEIYAQVSKLLGGTMCHVVTLRGETLLCHIRGKFRGRGKRDNFIGNGSWLLVGLREWEKEASKGKLLNCDIIEVYSESDKIRLKNSVTDIDWSLFISNDIRTAGFHDKDDGCGIVFADERTQEFESLINSQMSSSKSSSVPLSIKLDEEEITIDDL